MAADIASQQAVNAAPQTSIFFIGIVDTTSVMDFEGEMLLKVGSSDLINDVGCFGESPYCKAHCHAASNLLLLYCALISDNIPVSGEMIYQP